MTTYDPRADLARRQRRLIEALFGEDADRAELKMERITLRKLLKLREKERSADP